METATDNFAEFGASSKHFVRQLLIICKNRLELLMVEVQEERERLLHAILLALGVSAFGLLAGVALTQIAENKKVRSCYEVFDLRRCLAFFHYHAHPRNDPA